MIDNGIAWDRRGGNLARRRVLQGAAGLSFARPPTAPIAALAQQPSASRPTPPNVVTSPPRQWGRHAQPNIFPDPDIIIVDDAFKQ